VELQNQYADNKIPYYVSVQAMQVLADPKAANYELEIIADELEVIQLKQLFDEMYHIDTGLTGHSLLNPLESTPSSELMYDHDQIMKQIYKRIYDCGTEETKQHIESMNIL